MGSPRKWRADLQKIILASLMKVYTKVPNPYTKGGLRASSKWVPFCLWGPKLSQVGARIYLYNIIDILLDKAAFWTKFSLILFAEASMKRAN